MTAAFIPHLNTNESQHKIDRGNYATTPRLCLTRASPSFYKIIRKVPTNQQYPSFSMLLQLLIWAAWPYRGREGPSTVRLIT